jgi:hypothetical protein
MKDLDKELKDLFQEKNLEDAFPAEESNWLSLSAEIEAGKKKKRRYIFYLNTLLFGGLGLVLGSIYLLNASASNTPAPTLANAPVKTQHSSEEMDLVIQSANTNLKHKTNTTLNPTSPSSFHTHETSIIPTSNISTPPVLIKQPHSIPLTTKKTTVSTSNTTRPNMLHADVASTKTFKKSTPPSNKQNRVPEIEVPNDVPQTNTDKDSKSTLETEIPLANKDLPSTSDKIPSADTTQNLASDIPPLAPQTETTPSAKNDSNLVVATPPKQDSASNAKPDTAAKNVAILLEPSKGNPLRGWYLEGGITYLRGWQTQKGREAAGINPLAGIQYHYPLSPKLGLSAGLAYCSILHMGLSSHTSTATRIRFGEETEQTVITPLSMQYLMMPLKLHFNLTSNDFIGLGYSFAYLLDARSKVETYSNRFGNTTQISETISSGYSKGFNPYDGQLSLVYRRRIYKEWHILAELFYGVLDIKKNKTYSIDDFERTSGLRISMVIGIWNK